jgi:predicted phosphodiesterase
LSVRRAKVGLRCDARLHSSTSTHQLTGYFAGDSGYGSGVPATTRIGPGPASAPIACVADIHGNLPALEAVLAELSRRAVSDLFVAGDLLLGGEQPLEVWRRLGERNARCVRGQSDLALASVEAASLRPSTDAERASAQVFGETQRALGELIRRQLGALPERLRVPMIDGRELLLVHGSPLDPSVAITHDMEDDEIGALLADDPADLVLCGASHVPFVRALGDVQIVNVGSVGQAPGARVAHYTIVSPKVSGAEIEQSWVEY